MKMISDKVELPGYFTAATPPATDGEHCDWCQGGACDLVYTKPSIPFKIYADVDENDGMLCIHINDVIVAQRKMNFCPMCGRRIGE